MQILTRSPLSAFLFLTCHLHSVRSAATVAETLILDEYKDPALNALGMVHGGSELMIVDPSLPALVVNTRQVDGTRTSLLSKPLANITDYFFSNFGDGCNDMRKYADYFVHLILDGSSDFSITIHEHNKECNEKVKPYPAAWDSVDASRYTWSPDGPRYHVWVPMSHFWVDFNALIGITFESFWSGQTTRIFKTELVPSNKVPKGFTVPIKPNTGPLVLQCKDPNTYAFGIDDGQPRLALTALEILKNEDVKATFFVVGKSLSDNTTDFAKFYKEAIAQGHEIGAHSWDHPQ